MPTTFIGCPFDFSYSPSTCIMSSSIFDIVPPFDLTFPATSITGGTSSRISAQEAGIFYTTYLSAATYWPQLFTHRVYTDRTSFTHTLQPTILGLYSPTWRSLDGAPYLLFQSPSTPLLP